MLSLKHIARRVAPPKLSFSRGFADVHSAKAKNARQQQVDAMKGFKNFTEHGVGGMDDQLQDICRRAFASRLLPPKVARKLGMRHTKGENGSSLIVLPWPDRFRLSGRYPPSRSTWNRQDPHRQANLKGENMNRGEP